PLHVEHHRVQAATVDRVHPVDLTRGVVQRGQAHGLGQPPGRVDGEDARLPAPFGGAQADGGRGRGLAHATGTAADDDPGPPVIRSAASPWLSLIPAAFRPRASSATSSEPLAAAARSASPSMAGRAMLMKMPPGLIAPPVRSCRSARPSRVSCTGISSSVVTKCTAVCGDLITRATVSECVFIGPTLARPETSVLTSRKRLIRPVGGASITTAWYTWLSSRRLARRRAASVALPVTSTSDRPGAMVVAKSTTPSLVRAFPVRRRLENI